MGTAKTMKATEAAPVPVSRSVNGNGNGNGKHLGDGLGFEVGAQDLSPFLEALSALRGGDFTVRLPRHWTGVAGKLADTFNEVVDLNQRMARELGRLGQSVGKEGKTQQRASLGGGSGAWTGMEESINVLIEDLVRPTNDISHVIGAVAKGDLSRSASLEVDGKPLQGGFLRTAQTVNTMVELLGSFASEVTRVAREVGTEGKLGGQAIVPGVAGTWKDLTDNVNSMASNLTGQVRNIAEVTTAVAKGDLSKKITVDVKGEILELKETINTMVDQLNAFASEVTRVAREVGTEGKLGGQAVVPGVAGTWKDLTDKVNFMASNLTGQVRNIAEVTTAVAKGDLSKKITADVRGEILQLKETINTMVDQLNAFASEVTRVAREVGTEGKLGGQAMVPGVAGTWKDLTDKVNFMASNLTGQVRNIAEVTTAVAKGDLSKKITADVRGEILQLKDTINTMVDQLNAFASEVTRVAREVGTEGKLGGQAVVPEVAGTWKDLTDNVNSMASNLTGQVRNIAEVTTAVAKGDLSKKITVDVRGEILQLKEAINTMVDQLRSFASEVTRVAREVGTEGKLGGQAYVQGVDGTWKDLTDNVNSMASNLTGQVRNIAAVTTALARGDLSKKITVDVKGEILELKDTINTMVDQLNAFASEVTRVAREVGTEGKLGGQAQVKGVSGTWKDLTDNVNSMASNLTNQVRGIAKVVTAVANGNLNQKLTVAAEGEIAALAETINNMIDTLATFSAQVTSVAREVGVEGRLGGQSNVPGAAGTWKDLTENVNQLAANLTTQVRAIAEVATAVTQGDLTRSINVEARGEVETLKDTINQMIANLRATTQKNADQDWLKTNLALFTRMLQGQKDPQAVSKAILSELSRVISAQHGVFYIAAGGEDGGEEEEARTLRLLSSFAYSPDSGLAGEFGFGQGLIGECAVQKSRILLNPAPEGYVRVTSGLGDARPHSIVILPALFEGRVKAVLELASFSSFNATHLAFLEQLMESIGIVLHTLEASLRTETLLKHLQSQQEELRKANQELEEKADQLARTSRFKSEFLSKMSHELRTPLNSMLILSQRLLEDSHSLTPKQLEYCKTIHTSGGDLLVLINDILDLSKVESGALSLDLAQLPFGAMGEPLERIFRHVAGGKGLDFSINLAPDLPKSLYTDGKRLEQILRNLLSNAFKFTEKGRVTLTVERMRVDLKLSHPVLGASEEAIAFFVADSGIGIAADKQKIIFEAFQQAESGTSRKYGGTGLGLSISSELAKLLGGQLSLTFSKPGQGSTFALYLPLHPPLIQQEGLEPEEAALDARPYLLADGLSGYGVEGEASEIRSEYLELQGSCLLVVDDDIRNIFAMTSLLEYHGIKVIPAESGAEALKLLADGTRVDGVLMDIMMPEMDGYDTMRAIRALPGLAAIPIVAVTAKAMKGDRQKCLEAGATDYITKPVNSQRMIAMLGRWLKP